MESDAEPQNLTTNDSSPKHPEADETSSEYTTSNPSSDNSNDSSVQSDNEHTPDLSLFHQKRYENLREQYLDEYLDLFKATFTTNSREHYEDSQIGAVIWTGQEKEAFFDALARKGSKDLAAVQTCVPSKSILEITDYRDLLREADADRQRYEKKPHHVSHLDIPAAIEIGLECEKTLDRAADALAAFQDHYDHTVGSRKATGPWLIDRKLGATIDRANDELETVGDSQNGTRDDQTASEPASVFHVSTFLQLSEELFMNASQQSHHDHWQDIAEPGQRPALTADVLAEFENLVISLTQRIAQSALFLAQSRIRATKTNAYAPMNVLTAQDVHAALDVLCLPKDTWDFWKGFARRSGIKVMLGGHGKNKTSQQTLSLTQVEKALSVRKSTGRRRSLSTLAGISSDSDLEVDEVMLSGDTDAEVEKESALPSIEFNETNYGPRTGEEQDELHSSSEEEEFNSIPTQEPYLDRQKRRQLVEDSQDDCMEDLDQKARQHEEFELMELLGFSSVKIEASPERPKRPRTLRKTNDEIQHWNDELLPMSQWERDGEPVPEDLFTQTRKRRKIA